MLSQYARLSGIDIGYERTKRGREFCKFRKHNVEVLPRGDKTELLGIGHTGGDLRVLENESSNCTEKSEKSHVMVVCRSVCLKGRLSVLNRGRLRSEEGVAGLWKVRRCPGVRVGCVVGS